MSASLFKKNIHEAVGRGGWSKPILFLLFHYTYTAKKVVENLDTKMIRRYDKCNSHTDHDEDDEDEVDGKLPDGCLDLPLPGDIMIRGCELVTWW